MIKILLGLLLVVSISSAGLEVESADYIRDNTKEIVLDTTTNLIWQDSDETVSDGNKKSWADAITYCEALTLGSYSDWRLPNLNELYMLSDKTAYQPSIDSEFTNSASEKYWSSTTVATNTDAAWSVDFEYGNDYEGGNKTSDSYSVRCVRAGQ